MFVLEAADLLGVRPFLRSLLPKLHQPNFSDPPARLRMKPAFTPDDRFDQCRLDTVSLRGRADRPVLTVFKSPFPPPIPSRSADEQQEQNQEHPAPCHPVLLLNPPVRVQPARVLVAKTRWAPG